MWEERTRVGVWARKGCDDSLQPTDIELLVFRALGRTPARDFSRPARVGGLVRRRSILATPMPTIAVALAFFVSPHVRPVRTPGRLSLFPLCDHLLALSCAHLGFQQFMKVRIGGKFP